MEKNELFICECHNVEHQLIFSYESSQEEHPDWDFVYCNVHLNDSMTFWQRVKYAFKYIFGYKSKYGAFDEIILQPKDWEKMQRIADKLKFINDKNNG